MLYLSMYANISSNCSRVNLSFSGYNFDSCSKI